MTAADDYDGPVSVGGLFYGPGPAPIRDQARDLLLAHIGVLIEQGHDKRRLMRLSDAVKLLHDPQAIADAEAAAVAREREEAAKECDVIASERASAAARKAGVTIAESNAIQELRAKCSEAQRCAAAIRARTPAPATEGRNERE